MAGRIRTIKPELLEDERVAELSSDAFRLFVGCILIADDHGNFRLAVGYLSGQVFWRLVETGRRTIADVEAARAELLAPHPLDRTRPGLIYAYRLGGQVYGHVTGWERHQKVEKVGKPRCPGPDAEGAVRIRIDSAVVQEIRECLSTGSRGPLEGLSTDLRPPTSDLDLDLDQKNAADAASEPPGSGSSVPRQEDPRPSPEQPDPRPEPSAPATPELLALSPTEPAKPSPCETVFAAYVAGWRGRSKGHRPPVLTDARRKLIAARLREFSAEDLALACQGVWRSGWHVEHGHTAIELVLRNAGLVEQFRAKVEGPRAEPVALALYRQVYPQSVRRYGPYSADVAFDLKAADEIATEADRHARSRVAEVGGDVDALTEEVLVHWMESFLRDKGNPPHFDPVGRRHPLHMLPRGLNEYELPWTRARGARAVAASPPAVASAAARVSMPPEVRAMFKRPALSAPTEETGT